MFPALSFNYWLTIHGLVTVVAVLLYVITSHLLLQRRHPAAAIAWVLFILLVPYVALPAYLAFGSRKRSQPPGAVLRLAPPAPSDAGSPPDAWAVQTALALGQPAPAGFDELHLHADGSAALQALWQTIDGARHSIDVCSFILGRDAVGHAVVERLSAKACAGVRVRLMVDGLGRLMAGGPNLRPLTRAGGEVARFVPPLRSPLMGRSNLRDHRKMVIADAAQPTRRLWCGGRNLACEYFEGAAGKAPWRDLSFDLRGAVVHQAQSLFEHDWAFANGRPAPVAEAALEYTPANAPAGALTDASTNAPTTPSATAPANTPVCVSGSPSVAMPADTPASAPAQRSGAQLIASGPDQVDDTLYALLITAAYQARRRIAISTPYFVPDAALLMGLCLAARRGVVVDLLIPATSNHRLSDIARRRALRSLAAAGGRIWLAPGMLHGKLVVVDDVLALAGSANLDSRSLFLNYELMMAFHAPDMIAQFADWFESERARARRTLPKRAGLIVDIADGLVLWLGFQL